MTFFNSFTEILIISTPLLLISLGTLFSELCGILAVFCDGIINLSAFLFFLFAYLTGNIFVSILITILFCCLFIFLISLLTERTKANPFLIGLSINLFTTGFIQILSKTIFNTQGVLDLPQILTPAIQIQTRIFGTIFAYGISILIFIFLKYTPQGICFRITGTSKKLLVEQGKNPTTYKVLSWQIATCFSCIAGIILTLRISSFVPNISSGRGWLALAAVLAGQKKILGIVISILVFSTFEYLATTLQGSIGFIPPSIMITLPYLVAIIAFLLLPSSLSVHEQNNL